MKKRLPYDPKIAAKRCLFGAVLFLIVTVTLINLLPIDGDLKTKLNQAVLDWFGLVVAVGGGAAGLGYDIKRYNDSNRDSDASEVYRGE